MTVLRFLRGEDSVWLWGGAIAQSFRVGPGECACAGFAGDATQR